MAVSPANAAAASRTSWAENAASCTACSETFTSFRRRHHCRCCGQVFCNDCSAFRASLPGFPTPQRICGRCWLAQQSPPETNDDLRDAIAMRNQLIESLKAALRNKTEALEGCRQFLVTQMLSQSEVLPTNAEDDEDNEESNAVVNLLRQCEVSLQSQRQQNRTLSKQYQSLKKQNSRTEQASLAKQHLIEDLQAQVAELQSSLHSQSIRAAENHKLTATTVDELTAELNVEREKTRRLLAGSTSGLTPVQPVTLGKMFKPPPRNDSHWALHLRDPLIRVHAVGDNAQQQQQQQQQPFAGRLRRVLCGPARLVLYCCCCCRRRRVSV